MLLLTLLRHAKSAYPMGVSDQWRPLNDRGQRDAPAAGAALAQLPPIDLALVSPATRAQQTWQLAQAHLPDVPLVTDPELYLASPRDIVEVVQRHSGDAGHVVVVAHNPGLAELGMWLAEPGSDGAYEQMVTKFPTSAIAHLALDCQTWAQMPLTSGSAQLVSFTVPRG